jgi:hypothetical protein
MTAVLIRLLDLINVKPNEVVIRAHPLWTSKVGARLSSPAEQVWKEFADRHGCHYINSASKASTQHLIDQADLVIVNGSNAAMEAGAAGKQIICFGKSQYQNADLAVHLQSEDDWSQLKDPVIKSREDIVRATLRYVYCVGWRFPQYVNFVRGLKPTSYEFFPGGNADPVIRMLKENRVDADDPEYDTDTAGEDRIIELCLNSRWLELAGYENGSPPGQKLDLKRRPLFRLIDRVRDMLPKGDV